MPLVFSHWIRDSIAMERAKVLILGGSEELEHRKNCTQPITKSGKSCRFLEVFFMCEFSASRGACAYSGEQRIKLKTGWASVKIKILYILYR